MRSLLLRASSLAVPVVAGRLESIYLELLRARRRAASGTLAAP